MLSRLVDIIHGLFLVNKTSPLPYFEQMLEYLVKFRDPTRPWADRQWALCVLDDLIEHCGPVSAQYQQFFIQPMLQYVTDKSPAVRQAACYGCGVLGQFGGEQFAITCAQAVPLLVEVIKEPKSREAENPVPTENAISAVTKILKCNNSSQGNVDEILHLWFYWLPIVIDDDEAPHIYEYLCDLNQTNHPFILGNNNANLPRIVSVIAQAFASVMIKPTSTEGARMIGIVKQIGSNPEIFQACVNALIPEQKHGLEEAYRELTNPSV